jgi:signal peptidase II
MLHGVEREQLTRSRVVAVTLVTAALTAAADQLTKWWALEALADGPVHVIWTLRLELNFNSGAAFSTARGLTPFITAAGVALVVVLFSMTRSITTVSVAVALGLLLGGASGNLIDRLVRDHGGAVIDFVDLQWWPVFNLADAAIVVGGILLVLLGQRQGGAS